MAKGWKATTRIQYGAADGTVKIFMPGDPVTGLSKEEMAQLWDAGSLEEAVVTDSDESASAAAETGGSTATGTPKGTEGGGTEGTPAA